MPQKGRGRTRLVRSLIVPQSTSLLPPSLMAHRPCLAMRITLTARPNWQTGGIVRIWLVPHDKTRWLAGTLTTGTPCRCAAALAWEERQDRPERPQSRDDRAGTDIWAAGMRSSDAKGSWSPITLSFLPSSISSNVANGIHAELHGDPTWKFRGGVDQAADGAAWDGLPASRARTNSPDPAPHFVKTRSAAVNGTSTGCTRSGGRM